MRILVVTNTSRSLEGWAEAMAMLGAAGHDVFDPGPLGAAAPKREDLAAAEGLLTGVNPIPRAVLEAAPRLRVVAKLGIGVDNVDLAAATELGIVVCSCPGSNTVAVADHTLALMLALTRNVLRLDSKTRSGKGWVGGNAAPAQLTGKRLAIIGTGSVGKAVARRAVKGFDMVVTAYDPYPDAAFAAELGVIYQPFPDVLRGAEVVSVHAPLVDGTRNMIGARELSLLAPQAILITTARGGVVDEAALVAALKDGTLAGAGIDVFVTEPCTANLLFELPNTVLTPHVAGLSPESSRNSRLMTAENLIAALAGRPLRVVNTEVLSMPHCRVGKPNREREASH